MVINKGVEYRHNLCIRRWVSKMWNDYYILWNYAAVSITDIRYMKLEAYEEMKYKFPTSTFVLTIQGEAVVTIDNQTYEVSRFYVLHGGKGSKLVIQAGESGLHLYYLMYRANLPSGGRNDLGRLMERINPFQMNYGFTPDMPTILYEQLKQMHFCGSKRTPFSTFRPRVCSIPLWSRYHHRFLVSPIAIQVLRIRSAKSLKLYSLPTPSHLHFMFWQT